MFRILEVSENCLRENDPADGGFRRPAWDGPEIGFVEPGTGGFIGLAGNQSVLNQQNALRLALMRVER